MQKKTSDCIEQLRNQIYKGQFLKDGRMPSERKLMEMYNVGRGTIRVALKTLIDEGLLEEGDSRHPVKCIYDSSKSRRVLCIAPCTIDFVYLTLNRSSFPYIVNELTALKYEYDIVYMDYRNIDFKTHEKLRNHYYAGVIILNDYDKKSMAILNEYNIPVVLSSYESSDDVPYVGMDFFDAGYKAGKALIASGVKNIAALSDKKNAWLYKQMLEGLYKAVSEHGMQLPDSNIYHSDYSSTYKELEKLGQFLKTVKPDGIFCLRDYRARMLYAYVIQNNIRVPDELQIIGFDNHTFSGADFLGLSTIEESVVEIGLNTVRMLDEWIRTGRKPLNHIIKGQYIKRKSIKTFPE